MRRLQLKKINFSSTFHLQKVKKSLIYLSAVVIFLILNYLASQLLPLRLDLSANRAYSLSSSTEKILKDMKKPTTITFFVSSDLPTKLLPLRADVVDVLNEYKRAGGGKVTVKLVDPKHDEKAMELAKKNNIFPLQVSQTEQDKYAVSSAYFGVVLENGGKSETIPQLTDLGGLEYNLTSAIYKLTRSDLPKIAITGYNTSLFERSPISVFEQVLGQQFGVYSVDFSTKDTKLQPNTKALVVFDNRTKTYTVEETAQIADYIKRGGKVLLFMDGVWVGNKLDVGESKSGLFGLARTFGIEVQKDLLLSESAEIVNFGSEQLSYYSAYPYWLKTSNFASSSLFSNVTQLSFPWVSSIAQKKEGGNSLVLVRTTRNSWRQTKDFTLNPQEIAEPQLAQLSVFSVVAQWKTDGKGEIVVIPSSRFVEDQFLSRSSNNLDFVLNILNEYASEGALTGIRQRAAIILALPDLTPQAKDVFKFMNILALPALFACYGIWRITKRSRQSK